MLFNLTFVLFQKKQKRVTKKVSKRMSTFNLGSLFGTETSPTYSQEVSHPVESFEISTLQTVSGDLPRKQVKVKRRISKRMSTFNFGLLFGTENSPTYSQENSPMESFEISTYEEQLNHKTSKIFDELIFS